jgi:hypothetical protein
MNRLKKIIAIIAIVSTLGISLTSCHRDGCPNNFKLSDVNEVVQTILR